MFAVQCTILEVDFEARDRDPHGYLFYDLDEPIGHDPGGDQLYSTKEEAIEALKRAWEEDEEKCQFPKEGTLDSWRRGQITFIRSTWGKADQDQPFPVTYKTKERGKEWVSIYDVLEKDR